MLIFFYSFICLGFLYYLAQPSLSFPEPPRDAVRSLEPADSETEERRAYFTNYTREEINDNYQDQYTLQVLGIEMPSYILTYPPEDAYGLIRDQTRSTHLREIVYPFRESLFVNEFVAKEAKDDIWYKGEHFDQKITVKIKTSDRVSRLAIGLVTCIVLWFLVVELVKTLGRLLIALRSLKWPFFWN